jgi:hypothetical protein
VQLNSFNPSPKSQKVLKLFLADIAVTEDPCEQAGANGLATMDGDHRTPAILVAQKMMAALGPYHIETKLAKGLDELGACRSRQRAQKLTATR